MPTPAEYTRYSHSHELQAMHGKQGEVYEVVEVGGQGPVIAPAGFQELAPYDLMLVEFPDGKRRTLMGFYGEKFKRGDQVECAPAIGKIDETGIIPYVIKVRHPVVPARPGQTRFG
jgi:hypothetical protein